MLHVPKDFPAATKTWPERWRDEYEERAAILEYEAGMKRQEAEKRAFAQIFKLMREASKK